MRRGRVDKGLFSVLSGVAWLLGSGCAPSLESMTPARTTPAGHLQIATSLSATTTSGDIRDAVDAIGDMNTSGGLTMAEIEEATEAAGAALVQPPSIGYQISLTYGLSRRFEVGARTSLNALRGFGRWQFLRVRPGIYGALGLGVSTYFFGPPVQAFVDEIEPTGYSRWDLDVPLSFGYSGRSFHLWGGPKLVVSSYDASVDLCIRKRSGNCVQEASIAVNGSATYLAGQAGIALGYSRFWVALELTVARVDTSANLVIARGAREEHDKFDKGGLAIAPALGLIAWF
jgi:hypothetical protein